MALPSSKKDFIICDVIRNNIAKEVLLFTPNQPYTEITFLIICLSTDIITTIGISV